MSTSLNYKHHKYYINNSKTIIKQKSISLRGFFKILL